MDDTYNWLQVQRIAEELVEAYPELDPLTVTFPKIKELVQSLPGFVQEEGKSCNERILEAIQGAWIEESND